MILLQNPSIPVATSPIEIDAAIVDIKNHLNSDLIWMTHGYGRAYKNIDSSTGNTLFFPEIYLGRQNNSERYINITPDNDKQGQCFFFVTKETVSEFQTGMYSFLSYEVAIIFSVNLDLINQDLLATEIYQQNLIAQVRDVLTRKIIGSSYQLKINSIDFLFETVFSEFDIAKPEQLEKAPLSHFRFNCTIKLPEVCPTPVIIPDPVRTNLQLWLNIDKGVNGGSVSNGDAVYEWQDQSGNDHHFTQTTAARQPIYYDNVINTKSSITFLSDLLEWTGTFFSTSQPTYFTIYAVLKLNEITDVGTENQRKTLMKFGPNGWASTPAGSYNVGLEGAISTNGAGYERSINYTYSNAGQTLLSPPDLNPHYISILSHGESYIDGVQKHAGPGATLLITGDKQYIGGWNNSYGQFSLSEILIYNVKHNADEQKKVELYLKTKYSI